MKILYSVNFSRNGKKANLSKLTYQRVKICDFVCPLNIAGDSVLSSKVISTTQA